MPFLIAKSRRRNLLLIIAASLIAAAIISQFLLSATYINGAFNFLHSNTVYKAEKADSKKKFDHQNSNNEDQVYPAEHAHFVACRQRFMDEANEAAVYKTAKFPVPIPASLFISDNNLYVVLINEVVNLTIKGLVFHLEHEETWMGVNMWQVLFNGNVFNCSTYKSPAVFDDHHYTIIIECPNLPEQPFPDSDNRVNLTSLRHPEFSGVGKNLRVCNFPAKLTTKQRYKMVACTQVADGTLLRIPEWIEYHLLLGFQHFVIYLNDNNWQKYANYLDIYITKQQVLTLVPMYYFVPLNWPMVGTFTQRAAQTDCIYRFKRRADWIALHDVDEFFYLRPESSPENDTLLGLLDQKRKESPSLGGVAFNNWFFGFASPSSINQQFHCAEENGPSGPFSRINAMVWRSPKFVWPGRQKVIVRPENVNYFDVHEITSGGPTVMLDPETEGYHVHYRFPYPEPIRTESERRILVRDESMRIKYGNIILERLANSNFSFDKRTC